MPMNMIPCGENCKHQQEGYCCLEENARITGASKCRYFDEQKPVAKKKKPEKSND